MHYITSHTLSTERITHRFSQLGRNSRLFAILQSIGVAEPIARPILARPFIRIHSPLQLKAIAVFFL